jgi:hypothetical protein
MTKQIDTETVLGFAFAGTPQTGQKVTLSEDDAVQRLFGAKTPEMGNALLRHCLKVLKADEASDEFAGNDERLFMMAAVAEIAPRDGVERLLAVQMAATHIAMVRAGRWLSNSDQLEQAKVHVSGFTKLARTYAAQMEALRKHRNGGKPTVIVQHVNVADGGKAIVGNVQTGEGGT